MKKSRSDLKLKNNRVHSRCYHYSTNDLDDNYSPPDTMSADRFSYENDDDDIPVHPDPVAVTKILNVQRKISTVLDSIFYELDRIPLPDGENDLLRRQQRVAEFSTRLSRNYLYDLGRQITDIQRHIKAIAPNDRMRLTRRGIILHMQAIEHKLISTHQLLLTALSAYWKHIPSSVLKNHPGKLKEILQVVVQVKNICTDIKLAPELYCSGDERDVFLGKETENRCSAILGKFRLNSDNESQVPSHTTRSTVHTPSRSKKQKNRKMSNRLSMYTMDMRLAKSYQPKKSHSMFQMTNNRRPNYAALRQQQSNVLPACKKSRLTQLTKTNETAGNRTAKISVPLKEDDIQTMMDIFPSDLELRSARSARSDRKSKVYKESQICDDAKEYERLNKTRTNDVKEIRDSEREKCFASLLPVVGDLLSLVQNKQTHSKSLPSESIDTLYDFLQQCQPKVDSSKLLKFYQDSFCIFLTVL